MKRSSRDVPPLIPYFAISDVDESIKFYTQALDFELVTSRYDQNGQRVIASMCREDEAMREVFGYNTFSGTVDVPLCFYCYCEDVERVYTKALLHKAQSLIAPHMSSWGERICSIRDITVIGGISPL